MFKKRWEKIFAFPAADAANAMFPGFFFSIRVCGAPSANRLFLPGRADGDAGEKLEALGCWNKKSRPGRDGILKKWYAV